VLFGGAALLLVIAAAAAYVGLTGSPSPDSPTTGTATGVDPGSAGTATGTAAGTATGADPGSTAATGGDGGGVTLIGWAETESDVPAEEIGQLKGVGAWEDDELRVTLYNGSRWRITEILVRTSVLEGDQFVDSALLHPLVPKQELDAGVAPILERVAPDRRRPSVNPDDTRLFAGKAGQKPRAYRWRIEAARGLAPIRR
jgi:hypothetical protein